MKRFADLTLVTASIDQAMRRTRRSPDETVGLESLSFCFGKAEPYWKLNSKSWSVRIRKTRN